MHPTLVEIGGFTLSSDLAFQVLALAVSALVGFAAGVVLWRLRRRRRIPRAF